MKRPLTFLLLFLLTLLSLSFRSFSVGGPVLAGPVDTVAPGKWYSPSLGEFIAKVQFSPDQEIFGERYTYAQVTWIIHSFSSIMQFDVTSKESRDALRRVLTSTQKRVPVAFVDYSQLGIPGFLIGSMMDLYQHPPASGIQYLAQGLQKFNLASPALAQGYGYSNNQLVLPLWTASRNVCYFLMVILLIAAGFMIMFRVKVNAQTAVSIQIMIPKIIITLVLITFSYAIAGLIVDLTYLFLTLILSALSAPGVGVIANLGEAVKYFTGGYANVAFNYLGNWLLVLLLGFVGAGATGGISVIIPLVITIVLVWLLLKVWWMLLQTFISILIGFITAPWQILLGLIPGQKGGFSTWLRSMLANASVFIVVPLMFVLSSYLMTSPREWEARIVGSLTDAQWVLDLVDEIGPNGVGIRPAGNTTISMPLLGLDWAGGIAAFFGGLAILALIPKSAQMVKESLKVAAFKYGSAFGEAITGPSNFLGSDRVTGPEAVWRGPAEALMGTKGFRSANEKLVRAQAGLDTVSEFTGLKKNSPS